MSMISSSKKYCKRIVFFLHFELVYPSYNYKVYKVPRGEVEFTVANTYNMATLHNGEFSPTSCSEEKRI